MPRSSRPATVLAAAAALAAVNPVAAHAQDATIKPDGAPAPIPEVQALIGLVGHPIPSVDVFTYIGTEQAGRASFTGAGKGYGYGSPSLSNAGCSIELSPATCTGNTSSLTQGALGDGGAFCTATTAPWRWRAVSYTKRATFRGTGGAPSAEENTVMLSFRYPPFQSRRG